jgi:phosphatidate cytidylyltransferase
MLKRLLSGLIGIPLLVLLVFTERGFPFVLGVGLVSLIGLNEFYNGVRKIGAEPQEWVGMASAMLFMFAAQQKFNYPGFSLPAVLTIFVIVPLTIEMVRPNRAPIKNLGATFLGVVYVGWLLSYLIAIRSVTGQFTVAGFPWPIARGAWLVLYVMFASWASDTGAYFIGVTWGRHRMAPDISPGKSWEGFTAGLVSSIIICALMSPPLHIPLLHTLGLALGINIASVVGDLVESALKRDIGVKDFGTILPGHGGVLDRFDGLLFAAPLFYYYITFVLKY